MAGLTIIGGCANPRGTANALSAVIPVSSPAVSGPSVSSPAVSSPAASSPVQSSPAVTSATAATYIEDSTQINGAYTADNERQLVINYVAGDCTVSARGVATETATSITVHVKVTTRNAMCEAIGYIRNAVTPLAAPWGHRVVLDSSGAVVPVVDGALLLSPSWLPAGYQGGQIVAGEVGETQEWSPPDMTQTPSPGVTTCRPTAAGIVLTQGYGIAPTAPLLSGEYAVDDGTAVDVDRDDQGDFALYWPPPGHPKGWTVSLASAPECSGSTPLPLDTLLKIASGLH
jgi:hypothetical protein